MNKKELLEHSIFQFNNNGVYTQYLIPSEYSPLEVEDICGCWLLVFESATLASIWTQINELFMKVVHSNSALETVIQFEPIHSIDESTLCQNRGFNEAYTTAHYAEFLSDGSCEPDEQIIEHLNKLKQALEEPYGFQSGSDSRANIINGMIVRAFHEPNTELKWTGEPSPWTLYAPPIILDDVKAWTTK